MRYSKLNNIGNKRSLIYFHSTSIGTNAANFVQVLEMCNSLATYYNVKLITPYCGISNERLSKVFCEKIGVEHLLFDIELYKEHFIFRRFYPLLTVLKHRFNIFYIRNPYLISILFFFNRDFIFEAHHIPPPQMSRFQKLLYYNSIKSKNVKRLVFISNALYKYYLNIISSISRKSIILHDGVNIESFTPINPSEHYKAFLGIKSSRLIFTYAGSLSEDRNIGIVIEVANHFPRYDFYIIGGQEEQVNKLKGNEKPNQNNVKFTGYLNRMNMVKYLWASDYLLMFWSSKVPTINYCSPLKMFEYMATKRMIIGHDFPTIHEVLSDGVDAILVEPDSVESICGVIDNIGSFDKDRIARNAYNKVKSNYTWFSRAERIFNSLSNSSKN